MLLLLSTILGLSIDAFQQQICFSRPCLPPFLRDVFIQGLKIGDASMNISIRGEGDNVDVQIEREKGSVEAIVYK